MKYIWGSLIVGILGLGFLNEFVIRFGRAADVFMLLHIVITLGVLFRYKKGFREILIFAFLARVALMFWDLNFSRFFALPNSSGDTASYYYWAIQVGKNISLLGSDLRGGTFSKIIGLVYSFTGTSKAFGQYINVLLGVSIVMIVNRTTALLKLNPRARRNTLLIAAFFPNSMVMSAIFLREIFPTFFVAASLYFFCRWFIRPRTLDMLVSLFMLALASMFHSGVIGIFLGYAYAFLFYKHRDKGFAFSPRSVFAFILLAAAAYLATSVFQEQLFGKFSNVEEISDVYQQANRRMGGSAYLRGLEINSLPQFFLYGPVKMLYFLISPVPMDWRGGMDIFTFVADSALYLYVIVMLYRNRKLFGNRKPLITSLTLMMLGAVIIFGIGVGNSGTAVRHRQKLIPVFLIMFTVMLDSKYCLAEKTRRVRGYGFVVEPMGEK